MEKSRALSSLIPTQLRQRFESPWKTLSQMEDEVGRWLTENNSLNLEPFQDRWDFTPRCDLREGKKEYIARFDIPGVNKEDIKIEIEGNRLTVRGERRAEKEEKEETRYYAESYYGTFRRSFNLPSDINEDKVDAQYDNGVLTVRIGKAATSTKTKEISVH